MTTYNLTVKDDIIEPLPIVIPSGNVQTHTFKISFSAAWDNLSKMAVFVRDGKATEYTVDGDERTIPGDVLQSPGDVTVGFYGYTLSGGKLVKRISTNTIAIKVIQGAYTDADTGEVIPPPSAYETLTDKVDEHIANKANPHGVTASQVGAYTKSEADAKTNKKLDKLTDSDVFDRLYAVDMSGVQKAYYTNKNFASDGNIAQYGTGGTLVVATPTADTHAATKKYIDDKVGTIDTALDDILAIQNSLIGGATV